MEATRANGLTTFDGALKEIRDVSSPEAVTKAAQQAAKAAKEAAMEADRTVHSSPWLFIGAAALTAGTLGFLAGRKMKL